MDKVPPGPRDHHGRPVFDWLGDPVIYGPVPAGGRPLTAQEWLLAARAERRRTAARRWHFRQARRNPSSIPEPTQRDTRAELEAAAARAGRVHQLALLQGTATEIDMLPAPPMRRTRAMRQALELIDAMPAIAPGRKFTPPPKPWTRERI